MKFICKYLFYLYTPLGTGKTSLCRALAQKISIRMSKQFLLLLFLYIILIFSFPNGGCLVEINAHSLFSKVYFCLFVYFNVNINNLVVFRKWKISDENVCSY
jgi:hypothetical protein